ncbi:7-carboxy-7-deazaguanine synthase [Aquincola sp. S2]|uniref:7-carboxy-7-deazaguanine synthase n=1 Tax=Pseudaquabacterium terrae TaxID=2732868 RepID=A0ABX2EBV6_9BURK|nr:7-carboxy-7-deazaguanine synthase [Aquabacterium terrae]NRF66048.1 7-carboxy-7-deazaguanine synthase [Aquabacterium terrae]
MPYQVKEIFRTLQGEGRQAGRVAVFCRFAGCNLWSGREADRAEAVCRFCDTDFVGTDGSGGGRFADAAALAAAVAAAWGTTERHNRFVVLTGGEPALQLDTPLIDALHAEGFQIAIETNGSLPLPPGLDWICVSPKAGAPWVQRRGDELKLVVPQPGIDPLQLEAEGDFAHWMVQPMDGPARDAATDWAVQWCLDHPRWRLCLQTHKMIGIR